MEKEGLFIYALLLIFWEGWLRHVGRWVCLTHWRKGQDHTVISSHLHRTPRGAVFQHQQFWCTEKKTWFIEVKNIGSNSPWAQTFKFQRNESKTNWCLKTFVFPLQRVFSSIWRIKNFLPKLSGKQHTHMVALQARDTSHRDVHYHCLSAAKVLAWA